MIFQVKHSAHLWPLISPCIEEMLIFCLFVRKGDWDTEQLRKMLTAIHHLSSRAALKLQLTYWMILWLESYPWNCPTILHPWKNITAGMWVVISDLVFSSQRNCWKLSFTYIQAWLCPTWPHSCVSQEECGGFLIKRAQDRASLVAQWLRICLPMQGTRVRALVWEDPTCHGAAGPVSHNCWACASGACAPQREGPR